MSAPVITPHELREKLDAAALDVCDQSEIIKMATEKVDDDDPSAAVALLRSIQSFNDLIFSKLESLIESLPDQEQKGGA